MSPQSTPASLRLTAASAALSAASVLTHLLRPGRGIPAWLVVGAILCAGAALAARRRTNAE